MASATADNDPISDLLEHKTRSAAEGVKREKWEADNEAINTRLFEALDPLLEAGGPQEGQAAAAWFRAARDAVAGGDADVRRLWPERVNEKSSGLRFVASASPSYMPLAACFAARLLTADPAAITGACTRLADAGLLADVVVWAQYLLPGVAYGYIDPDARPKGVQPTPFEVEAVRLGMRCEIPEQERRRLSRPAAAADHPPPPPEPATAAPPPPDSLSPPATAATDSDGHPAHGPNFEWVKWYGATYTFTPRQGQVVEKLWECWEQGGPGLSQNTLLEAAGSVSGRLRDLFRPNSREHPAWGTMIAYSKEGAGPKGMYWLRSGPTDARPKTVKTATRKKKSKSH